jgi:Na+/H+ antiporter NhaD/arsenite permease-like protein
MRKSLFLLFLFVVMMSCCWAEGHGDNAHFVPPLLAAIPFLLLLLVIAVFPLLPGASHWWEHNGNKAIVSVVLGVPVGVYIAMNDPAQLLHTAIEYWQFLSLLTALFITAGGIHFAGDLRATPRNNTLVMMIGYVLASLIGTTGAAMVLIYPLLKMNSERKHVAHTVIFFIFLVCNMGGMLTPIGDPPLFLGFLRGIHFFWFLYLLPMWAFNGVVTITVYYLLDSYYWRCKETLRDKLLDVKMATPLRAMGLWNILFLAGVMVSVAAAIPSPYREGVMYLMIALSLWYAKKSTVAREARERNHFTFNAIVEVAVVFAGIFLTMIPALLLLHYRGSELGVRTPLQFFFLTGAFSCFLDNAPTFLVFLELGISVQGVKSAVEMMTGNAAVILAAVSMGAVLMGANTYIGNAPNFMVRAVAEEQKVRMPSFFGYMVWSIAILLPLFTLSAYIFLVLLPFPLW